MLNKLRSFSNTKLAGLLIAIIIIPFVFWGMGSVFSGGNTNNIAKINNEPISTKEFIKYINQSRMDGEYIKKNIQNNIIETIVTKIISLKLLNMEINELNILMSDRALAEKIKNNEVFLDDKKKFSRIKYEKFLLENNLIATDFEIRFKDEELKKNLFKYIVGGIKSPYFLNNKIYINENKEISIDYFNLDNVYNTQTSKEEIDQFINDNEENLKEDYIDFSFVKITPLNLIGIEEFNNSFFNKIDEIENSILNENSIEDIKNKFNLKLEYLNYYKGDQDENDILKEIYSKRNEDKIQLIDKNDFYLLYEITKLEKILPSKDDVAFIKRVKENLILNKKYEYNKDLFQKIQDKKMDDNSFINISKGKENIKSVNIKSINDESLFDKDSIKLLYSLPKNSFVLITNNKNSIYLAKITDILNKNLLENQKKEYMIKSNNKIISEIQNSYDLSLNKKYKVKVFDATVDRIKNNF
tara:strand:+ start:43 stop:1455 length:1413 start_codon:yes stop_codon:yes gene_type:complete